MSSLLIKKKTKNFLYFGLILDLEKCCKNSRKIFLTRLTLITLYITTVQL